MMKAQVRKRLYAAQQALALTAPEAAVLVGLILLFAAGFTVRHVQRVGYAFPPDTYAALDDAMAERAARSVEEALAALATGREDEPPAAQAAAGEAPADARPTRSRSAPSRLGPIRMDPNTASAATLERLPGIGPALAARIVEHRELHGPFRRPRDITAVRGIGPKTFERLEPYLYIGDE